MESQRDELFDLCKAALTAATAAAVDGVSMNGPEVSRCVESLKRLKDFPLTGDVLVSTAVDKRLRHLRQHKKEKIRLMAKWLLEVWSLKIKHHLSRNHFKDVGVVVSSVKTTDQDHHHQFSRNKRKRSEGHGDREANKFQNNNRRKVDVDGDDEQIFRCFERPCVDPKLVWEEKKPIKSFKCCDASRNKVREIILTALRRVDGEVSETDKEMKEKVRACDAVDVAVSVESVMFKEMGAFNGPKKLKYRSIMYNIKDLKNPDLRRKVLLGEVKPERLVTMTLEEMGSHQRQSENKKIREKLASLHHGPAKESSVDDKESEEKADYDEPKWLESLW